LLFYYIDEPAVYWEAFLLQNKYLLLILFSIVFAIVLLGYAGASLVERYISYLDVNKKKEVRIIIALIFMWIIVSGVIIYLIQFLMPGRDAGLTYYILWASAIATFLSTVLADDQAQRIKQGAFGAVAAGGVTAVVALIQKEGDTSVSYILYSFYGSTFGGFVGWLVFVFIAALTYYRYGVLMPFVELITSGFGKFRDQIILLENSPSLAKLQGWMERFERELRSQLYKVELNTDFKNCSEKQQLLFYKQQVSIILMAAVEQFNLVFGTVHFRSTIIRFPDITNKDENGCHDFELSYYGTMKRFKDTPFDAESKAYMMATGQIKGKSKTFDTNDMNVPAREPRDRYVSFILFKLTDMSVLSIDWAQDETKQRLQTLEDRINESLMPLLTDLMEKIEKLEEVNGGFRCKKK
jgi:hypothetical protein